MEKGCGAIEVYERVQLWTALREKSRLSKTLSIGPSLTVDTFAQCIAMESYSCLHIALCTL